jgi:hypothetical protein
MQLGTAAASSGLDQEQQQTPEELYAAWLARQYAAYIAALLQLLGSAAASASLQVAALSALMECVRHEAGPAAFSNRLFSRVISLLLTCSSVQPEVSQQQEGGTSCVDACARGSSVALRQPLCHVMPAVCEQLRHKSARRPGNGCPPLIGHTAAGGTSADLLRVKCSGSHAYLGCNAAQQAASPQPYNLTLACLQQ